MAGSLSRHMGGKAASRTEVSNQMAAIDSAVDTDSELSDLIKRVRAASVQRATTSGHGSERQTFEEATKPDGTEHPPQGMASMPSTYYNITHWRNRRLDALRCALQAYNVDDATCDKFTGFVHSFQKRVDACEGGKYEVASYGDPLVARRLVEPATIETLGTANNETSPNTGSDANTGLVISIESAQVNADVPNDTTDQAEQETIKSIDPTALDCGEQALRACIIAIVENDKHVLDIAFEEYQQQRRHTIGISYDGNRTAYTASILARVIKPEDNSIQVDENVLRDDRQMELGLEAS